MAPLTKDLDVLTTADASVSRSSTPSASKPATPATPSAPGVRADAVSVEVPVRVYGSRITQVPGQPEPNSEPFEEQTSTMIVFPQGAVLRMSTTVGVGQMLVVTNAKTKSDAICRVVKVRTFSSTQGYVEVEFTTSQKNYWGVRFPSDGPAPAPEASAPVAPIASAPVAAVPPAAPVAQKPVETVKPVAPAPVAAALSVPAPKPTAPVAAAPVVPAAPAPVAAAPVTPKPVAPVAPVAVAAPPVVSATPAPAAAAPVAPAPAAPAVEDEDLDTILNRLAPSAPVAASPAPSEAVQAKVSAPVVAEPAKPAAAIEFPAAPPPAPEPSLTLSELRGDAIAEPANNSEDTEVIEQESLLKHAAAESEAASPRRVTGSFSGGLSLTGGTLLSTSSPGGEATAEEAASSRLESENTLGGDYAAPAKKSNFLMIAACIGALVVVAGGGIFYFRTSTAGSKAAAPSAVVDTPKSGEAEPAGQTSERSALQNTASANVVPAQPAVATPVATPEPVRSAPAQPAANNDANVTVTPTMSHARQQKAIENVVDASSNAHPVTTQRADAGGPAAAPSLDGAGGGSGNNLSGLIAGNDGSSLKAPELRQEGPVKVGGNVKEPQLISHVMPQYPLTAKEAGIQGDVVIQTTVDAHGNVSSAKVVSGPMMLRGPALEALKRWKYAPSTLNGQPISVQMEVTVKFNNR
jgi:TonB family protein